jgi:tetratricopeptide (TPR) repeat protein
MYLKGHEYDAAASVAEEGLLLFPGDVALLRTAAFARLRTDAPQQAQDHFEDALTFQQNGSAPTAETAVLRAGLALALTVLDRPREADAALEKALAAAPDNPTVLHTCAFSLSLRKEQLDRALELSRRAVNRTPSSPLPLDTLGWVYFQRGNLEAAHRILRRALNAGPPSRRILEHFGDVQKATGNDAAARRYWQKALDRAPNRSSLRKKLESDSAS